VKEVLAWLNFDSQITNPTENYSLKCFLNGWIFYASSKRFMLLLIRSNKFRGR
jgi:hypothetical protein